MDIEVDCCTLPTQFLPVLLMNKIWLPWALDQSSLVLFVKRVPSCLCPCSFFRKFLFPSRFPFPANHYNFTQPRYADICWNVELTTSMLVRNQPCFFSYFVKSLEYFSSLLYQSKSNVNWPSLSVSSRFVYGPGIFTFRLYIPMFHTVICVSPGNVCPEHISVVIFSSMFSNISSVSKRKTA